MREDKIIHATAALSRSSLIADRYVCGTLLAQTRNARVFLGKDCQTEQPRILKQLSHPTPRRVTAFRREGFLLKMQKHPGLIQGDGYYNSGEQHWLVMEPARGRLLLELLQTGDVQYWSQPLRRKVVTHLTEALDNLHQQGWVHADLKPDNIYVDPDNGTVQIIDYSSTRLMGAEYYSYDYTPDWQHPSFCQGPVTEHSDCYALSLLVWSLWTGTHPFSRYEAVNFNKPPVFWPFPSKLWFQGLWLRRRLQTANPPSLFQIDQHFGIGQMIPAQEEKAIDKRA